MKVIYKVFILLFIVLSCNIGDEILKPSYGRIFVVNTSAAASSAGVGNGNTVSVIDGRNKKVIKILRTGESGAGAYQIAVNPITRKVYVTNTKEGTVTVFDGDSLSHISTILGFSSPKGIAVNPITNKIYVSNKNSDQIVIIDGYVDLVSTEIKLDINKQPVSVAVNPSRNEVYVVNSNDSDQSSFSIIDGANNSIRHYDDPLYLLGNSEENFIGVNTNTNKIYLNDKDNDKVLMINSSTAEYKDLNSNFSKPLGMAVSKETNKVYIANSGDSSVIILDGDTDNILEVVTVVDEPKAIVVNDFVNEVYITCSVSGAGKEGTSKVIVLDTITNKKTFTITGFYKPVGIAYLP